MIVLSSIFKLGLLSLIQNESKLTWMLVYFRKFAKIIIFWKVQLITYHHNYYDYYTSSYIGFNIQHLLVLRECWNDPHIHGLGFLFMICFWGYLYMILSLLTPLFMMDVGYMMIFLNVDVLVSCRTPLFQIPPITYPFLGR